MKNRFFTAISRTAPLVIAVAIGISSEASAQSNVSVDLSVLADGGYSITPAVATTGGILKMPDATMPRSSYFGPAVTVTNPVPIPAPVSAPVSAPTPEPITSVADAVPPPAPEPAPAAPTATPEPVVAEIAPPPAPEPELSETPALPPEPDLVAETPEMVVEDSSAENTETASTTTGPTTLEPGRAMEVVFEGIDDDLSGNAMGDLDAIAATISANEDLRIQLMAYAGGADLSSSKARRLSLKRALTVRSYFIEQGVRSTRIDVRALGDKTDEEPINRVDVNITER